jgi:hypothetical protein
MIVEVKIGTERLAARIYGGLRPRAAFWQQ